MKLLITLHSSASWFASASQAADPSPVTQLGASRRAVPRERGTFARDSTGRRGHATRSWRRPASPELGKWAAGTGGTPLLASVRSLRRQHSTTRIHPSASRAGRTARPCQPEAVRLPSSRRPERWPCRSGTQQAFDLGQVRPSDGGGMRWTRFRPPAMPSIEPRFECSGASLVLGLTGATSTVAPSEHLSAELSDLRPAARFGCPHASAPRRRSIRSTAGRGSEPVVACVIGGATLCGSTDALRCGSSWRWAWSLW
jgi:hypothetical protein